MVEKTLCAILATVHTRTGYDFTQYERQVVLRRIERRMLVTIQPDLPAYNAYLQLHHAEAHLLRDDLLVSVTCFFRNHTTYDALARTVVPLLFAGKTAEDTLRVWVAGCASGEEAYSLAMLLLEHAATLAEPPGIQMFASDVNEAALQVAHASCYPASIMIDVAPARLRRFFNLFRARSFAPINRPTPVGPAQVPHKPAQAPAASTPLPAASTAFDKVHMHLLQRHRSASVIVNAANEPVHLSEHAGRFIQMGDGTRSSKPLLLSNAVKYSPPREMVQMRLRQTAEEAVLEVVDQGNCPKHLRAPCRLYRARKC